MQEANKNVKPVKIGGLWLYANWESSPAREIIMNGFNYEKHVRAELEKWIPTSVGFLDCGANCGIHTLSAKSIKPDVPVVAVEMAPANIELLVRTVKLNGWTDVTVIPVAIAPRPMILSVNQDPTNPCANVEYQPTPEFLSGYPELQAALPLDFYNLPPIDLVKMDIEGLEYAAWQGASRLFAMRPRMIFEFCPQVIDRSHVSPLAELEWLIARGYRLTVLDYNQQGMRKTCNSGQEVLDHIAATSKWIADIIAEPI